jgi:hypothetical protein
MPVLEMAVSNISTGCSIVERPSWETIEAAIRRMDGDDFYQVALFLSEDEYFDTCGGPDHFVVGCKLGGFLHRAYKPEASSEDYVPVNTGQMVDYPLSECFTRDEVLQMSRTFVTKEAPDSSFEWERY